MEITPYNCKEFKLSDIKQSDIYLNLPSYFKKYHKNKETICSDIFRYYTIKDVTLDNCTIFTPDEIKESEIYKGTPNNKYYRNAYLKTDQLCSRINRYYNNISVYDIVLSKKLQNGECPDNDTCKMTNMEIIGEKIIQKIKEEYKWLNISYEKEIKTKYNLRFDGSLFFSLISNNSLSSKNIIHVIRIEYDGLQHFDRNNFWNRDGNKFNNQRNRDILKENLVFNNKESLIRVYNIDRIRNTIKYFKELIIKTIYYILNGFNILIKIKENVENLFELSQYNISFVYDYNHFNYDDIYDIIIYNDSVQHKVKLDEFLSLN